MCRMTNINNPLHVANYTLASYFVKTIFFYFIITYYNKMVGYVSHNQIMVIQVNSYSYFVDLFIYTYINNNSFFNFVSV